MSLLYAILAILGVILLGVIVEYILYRRRDRGIGDGPLPKRLYQGYQRWFGSVRRRTDRLMLPHYIPDVTSFKHWADTQLDDQPRLRAWLLSLPDEGLKALVQQLGQFCQELSINLNWLLKGDLSQEPRLEQTTRQIVIDYCGACLKAIQVQSELAEFEAHQQLINRLAQRSNRATTQRLLDELRARNLAGSASSDLLLAAEDERYAYVLNTLKAAARQDRATFDQIVSQIQQASIPEPTTAPSNNGL